MLILSANNHKDYSMTAISVIATELGFMSPDTFRNAIKQAVKAITKSLPATDGSIDTSSIRLVAADTDFFIDAKPDFIKERIVQVELNIDAKAALAPKGKGQNLSAVLKVEPNLLAEDKILKTKSKELYEDEIMTSLEVFIASRPLDGNGLMDLTEVRVTYFIDGSFAIESGIPVEPAVALSEQSVVLEAAPPDAIFAGVSPDVIG